MATAPRSFAKVAASAGKENVALTSFTKMAASGTSRDVRREIVVVSSSKDIEQGSDATNGSSKHDGMGNDTPQSKDGADSGSGSAGVLLTRAADANLVDAVHALNIRDPMPSLVVNGSGPSDISPKAESVAGFSEDAFQRTDSGSELGTKPPSLDGKSITSGTTFALDEKESLRPDDSASVKAAEDDDTFSGRGSIVAGSRIGSEAAGRAYRAQMYDIRSVQPLPERHSQGVLTPQSGSSGQVADGTKLKALVGAAGTPDAFNLFYRQTPDEKLLEALDSPKDRMFLLRLEKDVIEFVKDSKEPFIDLPPCNSFCRMLTHKLADYYHMTHQVDALAGAVRIFRTPFCRLPPSLTSISNPPTSGNTPPPTQPAMKIMRRGGEGDTGPNASKAASETGSDGKDKSLSAKEKLSREEREAAYIKARERIFGKDENIADSPPGEPANEDGNEMSRSSSVSAKDRSAKKGKPAKQRRDDSDSFDSRSQYTPFYPQPQVPTWVAGPQYPTMIPQSYNGAVQGAYQNPLPQQFTPQNPQYNQPMMVTGVPNYNGMPQQYPQPNAQRFGPMPHSAPITTYGSPAQSPPIAAQQWQQPTSNLYQNSYQQPRGPTGPGSQNPIPYQYGQLPNTVNPADPKNQHPIPGSFNRHAFNPKTQIFVPGGTASPASQPMSYQGSPHQGSPHHGSPHMAQNAYTPPQQQYSNGMGYNMARQGSNNSLPSYHASPHMGSRQMMHQGMAQGLPQMMPQNQGHGMPQGQGMMPMSGMPMMQGMQQGNGQFAHLPNHGNPATLPPKPPTGI